MLQRALSSRDEWLAFHNLELRRAFMFFNTLPSPKSIPNEIRSMEGPEGPAAPKDPDTSKKHDDLTKTSFYTSGGKDVRLLTLDEYRARGKGNEGLYRRDNNRFPEEMFKPEYGLQFQSIADVLYGYFTHKETKSRGERGYLRRRRVTVFNHEYIGKETNSVIDQDVIEAEDLIEEDLPVVQIFPGRINLSMLKKFGAHAISEALGVRGRC